MRAVTLSLSVFFLALASGVFGHHFLTSGSPMEATVGIAVGAAAALGLSLAVSRALKRDQRLWPLILSLLFHGFAAAGFFCALQSPDYSAAYKIVSAAAGTILALCGSVPLFTREKKA